jgi:hypothetical protein
MNFECWNTFWDGGSILKDSVVFSEKKFKTIFFGKSLKATSQTNSPSISIVKKTLHFHCTMKVERESNFSLCILFGCPIAKI